MDKVVLLCSGGLDSATLMAMTVEAGSQVFPLHFTYGQRHDCETQSAEKLVQFYQTEPLLIVNIDPSLFSHSSLVNKGLPVPKGMSSKEEIPSTYVPARNTIFLSYALAYSETVGASNIMIGVNSVDYSGYPDCRPHYIRAFQSLAEYALKKTVEFDSITVQAPLIYLTKMQIIQKGLSLGVDYSLTHSCYDPLEGKACGNCESCLLRLKAFKILGYEDPAFLD